MSERPKYNWIWTLAGFVLVGAVLALSRLA